MELRDILLKREPESERLVEINEITYCPEVGDNSEHFEATFILRNGEQYHLKSQSTMWMYNWQRMLDLNLYEDDKETSTILIGLSSMLDLIRSISQIERVDDFIDRYVREIESYPFLWIFLRELVEIAKCVEVENLQAHGNKALTVMRRTLQDLENKLFGYHEYIEQAFIMPYENGKKIDPLRLILNYELYCNVSGENSSLAQSVYYHKDHYMNLMKNDRYSDILNIESESYRQQIIEPYLIDGDFVENNLYFVDELFLTGIQYLIHAELIPKKCQLCGRYFLNKYSYAANYCNVPYKDTKDTCQEYVAKLKYKSKVSKNQINIEYSTIYNRLYSRIRRGTMDKSEAKFDELKALRDEYSVKYEMASDEDKTKYVERFKVLANRMYATEEDKEALRRKIGLNIDEVVIFNELAMDKSLETFKVILDNQIDMNYVLEMDEINYTEMIKKLMQVVKTLDTDEWFEIQCTLPFEDPML